tara:strand:- start:3177 stop:5054 length:1878 start_codon:yes stop_codon:yes gene_type:complete
MNIIRKLEKKPFFFKAIFFATSLVLLKWILSYIYFNEDFTLRVINESFDTTYYPVIKTFSEFNFSPSYTIKLDNLNIISFPILSLFINSLFFKILGSYSFLVLEIFCTTIFIVIFYNIFLKLNFSVYLSIFCSIFLFILPTLLTDLTFINIKSLDLLTNNFQKFYSMRFPRPIISNLFFFGFISVLINFYIKKNNLTKSFYALSTLMGITINIFFYLFFIEFFLFIIVFILKFNKNLFDIILKNIKHCFISLIIFLSFVLIFQLQIFYSEPDYIERLGVFYLNSEQKIITLKYLFKFFLGKNFIILFLLNTFFFLIQRHKTIVIFYFLFLSSILSPIFFFTISNKGVDYYHFFNLIVITGLLFPLISTLYLLDFKVFKLLNNLKIKRLVNLFIILMILYFNISNGLNFFENAKKPNIKRNNISEVVNFIHNNDFLNDKNLEILNLNIGISTWLLLNDYKNFSLLPVFFWTPKKTETLEIELISSLKFLKIDKDNFYNLIKNKRKSWRFKNDFVYNYFGRKYLANSLVTFNNDKSDFDDIEKKYINSNNLLITHQIIIPKSEIKRLLNKFETVEKKITPDVIILDKDDLIIFKNFRNNDYCVVLNNEFFSIYVNKKLKIECNPLNS